MNRRVIVIMMILSLVLSGCGPSAPVSTESDKTVKERATMYIEINGQIASVQLEDNATTTALMADVPFTIKMDDLHRNEKYHYFNKAFPTDAESVQTIEAGDVLLYQNNCLVIFYEAVEPTAEYTRIGQITDFEDIQSLFAPASVQIRFLKK